MTKSKHLEKRLATVEGGFKINENYVPTKQEFEEVEQIVHLYQKAHAKDYSHETPEQTYFRLIGRR